MGLASLLVRHRYAAMAVLLLATAGLGVYATRVKADNSVDVWFVQGDPALARYRTFQKTFGNDETVAIAVVDPKGIWRPDVIARLRAVAAQLEAIDGISAVHGLPTTRLIGGGPGALDVAPAMSGALDAAAVEALRRRVTEDPLLRDRLVTRDGTVALLYAQMAAMGDVDTVRPRVLQRVREVMTASGLEHHIAGIGVVYDALNRISQREGGLFMGAAFALIFLLLWPLFRRLPAVGTTVTAVGCAVVMTRGIYGLMGRNENMVTMTLPVLILILGVADCVHILRYRSARPDEPAAQVLGRILLPCLYTTLTTMVGFGALALSRMAVVRDLGIFAATGIGLAFVSSAVCCAFLLGMRRFRMPPAPPGEAGWIGAGLRWSARLAVRRKEAVLGATFVLLLGGAYGVSRIEVDTYSLGFLPADHPVQVDNAAIERLVGPSTPLEIVVDTGRTEGAAERTDVLRGLARAEAELRQGRGPVLGGRVRDALSLADVGARLHQVMGPAGAAFEVPADVATWAPELEVYAGAPGQQLDRLTDPARRYLRMTVSVPALSARQYGELIAAVLTVVRNNLPSDVTVQAAGYLPLYVTMMDYVVQSQVESFGLAFVVVFFLIGLLFRSVRMTALAVIPNVLPVFVTVGLMGFLAIHLDVATVTITSILIGIVVDDTIHYLHRFRDELAATGGDHAEAAVRTAEGAGRAITATSVIFALGVLVLGLASVKSIVYFGLLTSAAMVVAFVGDMIVLPAILVTLQPRLK